MPDGIWYFTDIKSNQTIWLPDASTTISVKKIAEDDSTPWCECEKFIGAKGPVYRTYKALRVRESENSGEDVWLFIRRNGDGGNVRYALSNAPADISDAELCAAADMRWGIEESFRDCKQRLGMDEYETRSYLAWHRHMQLVLIAHLFVNLFRERYSQPGHFFYGDDSDPCNDDSMRSSESPMILSDPSSPSLSTVERTPALSRSSPPGVPLSPVPADVLPLLIGKRIQTKGDLMSYCFRTEYLKFLSFYNACDLINSSWSQDSKTISKSISDVKDTIEHYWKSIFSYTRSYFRKQLDKPLSLYG